MQCSPGCGVRRRRVLGVTAAVPIDPGALAGTVTAGPLNRVQNTAVLYGADPGDTAQRRLIEDLSESMAVDSAKIATTALGALAGHTGADESPAATPVTIVAPDRLNEAQEQIIQAAMSHRLTVGAPAPTNRSSSRR